MWGEAHDISLILTDNHVPRPLQYNAAPAHARPWSTITTITVASSDKTRFSEKQKSCSPFIPRCHVPAAIRLKHRAKRLGSPVPPPRPHPIVRAWEDTGCRCPSSHALDYAMDKRKDSTFTIGFCEASAHRLWEICRGEALKTKSSRANHQPSRVFLHSTHSHTSRVPPPFPPPAPPIPITHRIPSHHPPSHHPPPATPLPIPRLLLPPYRPPSTLPPVAISRPPAHSTTTTTAAVSPTERHGTPCNPVSTQQLASWPHVPSLGGARATHRAPRATARCSGVGRQLSGLRLRLRRPRDARMGGVGWLCKESKTGKGAGAGRWVHKESRGGWVGVHTRCGRCDSLLYRSRAGWSCV